jgi:uncharacterized membrane protein YhaH (DUF805 family)
VSSTQQPEAGAVTPELEVGIEKLDFKDLETTLKGRFRRITFFWMSAVFYALMVACAFAVSPIPLLHKELVFIQPWWFLLIFWVGFVLSAWTLFGPITVLRLHDMNLSGGWAFLVALLPFVGFLPVLFGGKSPDYGSGMVDAITMVCWLALVLVPGSRGPNPFGGNQYKIVDSRPHPEDFL